MRTIALFLAMAGVSLAQVAKTTRAATDGQGRGVSGYVHRPTAAANVRVVLQPTIRRPPKDQVDWSSDGVGWEVKIHPGIGILEARELIPISIHEYRLKAAADRYWPAYDLLISTAVYRRDAASKEWKVVAKSERRFVWEEGFTLQDGDVITLREVVGF